MGEKPATPPVPATPEQRAAHAARVKALPLADHFEKLVLKAAYWGAKAEAQDLAQAALTKLVRNGATNWDYQNDPDAWNYLCREMKEERTNLRRKAARRRTDANTDHIEESPPSSDRAAARTAMDREEATWSRDELLRRLAKWPLAVKMVEACIAHGEMTPAELATHLGVEVKLLYTANERIRLEMAHVRAAWAARNGEPAK